MKMLAKTERNFATARFGYHNLKANSHGAYDPAMVDIVLTDDLYLDGDNSPMIPAGTVIAEVCALNIEGDEIEEPVQAERVALDDIVRRLVNDPRNISDYMSQEEYEAAVWYYEDYAGEQGDE